MFVDLETDVVLIRDVFGPQWYCRNCFHLTYPSGERICAWCKSPNIGPQPSILGPTQAMGGISEPEDREPTKHRRLKDGFWLLRQAESSD